MLNFLKNMFSNNSEEYKKMITEQGAIVVDVRSPEEFNSEHVDGSKNIPLGNIKAKASEIKSWKKPIILCCLSGGRASQALGILKAEGLEVYNAGGWKSLV